ncbi:MAG: DUF3187 family protein [Steroidobacteraceae bacterium]
MIRTGLSVLALLAASALAMPAHADAPDERFYGPLRARDLTPFGFLRLDMRPAHTVSIEPRTWAAEVELAYQNTWAMSPQVERYLTDREAAGRHALGPADLQAIRDLPGENYLVDLESAVLDVTMRYKFTRYLSGYVIASAVSYQGGFLDGPIEAFHEAFGFSSFGRPAARRNDVNILFDLKSAQVAYFHAPTGGGLSDPTIGVRHTGSWAHGRWKFGLEGAIKIPIAGRRLLLSTGRTDFGMQAFLQRRAGAHGFNASAAAVYFAGESEPVPQASQVVPTLIVGYEYRMTERTNLNLQGYLSKSTFTRKTTDLAELRKAKYQVTVGLHHRRDDLLYFFGITENLQNVNNTPDLGLQLGVALLPHPR